MSSNRAREVGRLVEHVITQAEAEGREVAIDMKCGTDEVTREYDAPEATNEQGGSWTITVRTDPRPEAETRRLAFRALEEED